jgi:hypothetical protein
MAPSMAGDAVRVALEEVSLCRPVGPEVAHDNARDDADRRRPSKADGVFVTWLFVVFEPVREASTKMWNAPPARRRGHGHGIGPGLLAPACDRSSAAQTSS